MNYFKIIFNSIYLTLFIQNIYLSQSETSYFAWSRRNEEYLWRISHIHYLHKLNHFTPGKFCTCRSDKSCSSYKTPSPPSRFMNKSFSPLAILASFWKKWFPTLDVQKKIKMCVFRENNIYREGISLTAEVCLWSIFIPYK
jgi:hypothetical protein